MSPLLKFYKVHKSSSFCSCGFRTIVLQSYVAIVVFRLPKPCTSASLFRLRTGLRILSLIIRVRIAFHFVYICYRKFTLNQAICSFGLGSLTLTRRPTKNPLSCSLALNGNSEFCYSDFITSAKALQHLLASRYQVVRVFKASFFC